MGESSFIKKEGGIYLEMVEDELEEVLRKKKGVFYLMG